MLFLQLIGLLFETDRFEWRDEFFLNFMVQLCNYARLTKAIEESGSLFFYWGLFFSGMAYLVILNGLMIYMNYFLQHRKHYVEAIVKVLRSMGLLLLWVLYLPFFESFLSVMNCVDGVHFMDGSLLCYQGLHIFYLVLAFIFLLLLFLNCLIFAMLYNETQPMQEDCLSRLESSFEVLLVVYRSAAAIFSAFCVSEVCAWIQICIYLLSSLTICYQYYKHIPYYNQIISVFTGSLVFIYTWISLNALLMKLITIDGHIIIIFIGFPLLALLVYGLREKRILSLTRTPIDKMTQDIDCLIHVTNLSEFVKSSSVGGQGRSDTQHRMALIGIINLHTIECQNQECPCQETFELYDVPTMSFSKHNKEAPHLDEVFLNHFIAKYYEDCLGKFINSPTLHIAFGFYLFKTVRNIHAALIELNIA